MSKKNFTSLILGTIGGVLFALGMCMAMIPEWNAFKPGIVLGVVGAVILLVMLMVRRKMEGKLGSMIYPYVIAARSMADMAVTDGRQGNIDAASRMLLSGGWIALLAGVVITAFIGAMIGNRMVKKHLEAVGMEG